MEDTEWNDILRTHGILPPKPPSERDLMYEEFDRQIELQKQQESLENKELDELDLMLEDGDEDDERAVQAYRIKRIQEMKAQQARERFGTVTSISESDFITQVTTASQTHPVVVLLDRDYIADSKLIFHHLQQLAKEHPAVKFVRIGSTECIKNFPDKNVPTILIYQNGELTTQLVGIRALGGKNSSKEGTTTHSNH